MRRALPRAFVALAIVVILALGAGAAFSYATSPSFRVVKSWEQPATARTPGQPARFLTVFVSGTDWRGFPGRAPPQYSIYVGFESGTPTYGHEVAFSWGDDAEAEIARSVVAWSAAGVRLTTSDGHELFIPATAYGRTR